jgi:hypothetical protein
MDARSNVVVIIVLEADAINRILDRVRFMLIGKALSDPACREFTKEALTFITELKKEAEEFANTAVAMCFAPDTEQPTNTLHEMRRRIISKAQKFCDERLGTPGAVTDIPRAFLEGLAGSNLDPA